VERNDRVFKDVFGMGKRPTLNAERPISKSEVERWAFSVQRWAFAAALK
jgi:hypothetical protein